MRAAFRTDASTQIGTGHVMRCLTLAQALRDQGHECLFICRDHEGHLGELIAQREFELHLLPLPKKDESYAEKHQLPHSSWLGASWRQDAEKTLKILSNKAIDWLIVDHYALDAQWEREVSMTVDRLMIIDDLADRNHDCAVLLDQNLGRTQSDYSGLVPKTCNVLAGPHYALLRPEFADYRPKSIARRRHPELKRIMVSVGGTDSPNFTGQILDALAESELPETTEIDVIMGHSAPHLELIRDNTSKLPFRCTVSHGVSNMAERMTFADLAIGAAGSTSWERCVLGVPSILLCQARNQSEILDALAATDAAVKIDSPFSKEQLIQHINQMLRHPEMLERMAYAAAKVCDGEGAKRIVNFINE